MPAPIRPPPYTPTSSAAASSLLLPAIEECGHPLALVLGLEEHRLGQVVDERVRLARGVEHRLRQPYGERGLGRDAVGQAVRGRLELLGWRQPR